MDGSHLAEAHAHFVYAKPRTFAAADRFVADLDASRKQPIAAGPAAGLGDFCGDAQGLGVCLQLELTQARRRGLRALPRLKSTKISLTSPSRTNSLTMSALAGPAAKRMMPGLPPAVAFLATLSRCVPLMPVHP